MTTSYQPHQIFSADNSLPRVLISPARYIQGPDVLDHLGRYLSLISSQRPAVLITEGGRIRFGERISTSLAGEGLDPIVERFSGECSYEEVDRAAAALAGKQPDCLVAVGGGKCLDAGKAVAYRLDVPVVICPTIASTDAPCSALAVMYSLDGIGIGAEFYPDSPALVVVDTRIIANAPVRHLVAGMADALASWYEASACYHNVNARNVLGGQSTVAALTIAEACRTVIYASGVDAVDAVRNRRVDEALERVVETNTLLSGIGFESGGLAVVHAVANGFTLIPAVREHYLHGELVAAGILIQATLLEQRAELDQLMTLFVQLGLPIHLGQLGLGAAPEPATMRMVMEKAMDAPFVHHVGIPVSVDKLVDAALTSHQLGLNFSTSGTIAAAPKSEVQVRG